MKRFQTIEILIDKSIGYIYKFLIIKFKQYQITNKYTNNNKRSFIYSHFWISDKFVL